MADQPGVHHELVLVDRSQLRQRQRELHAPNEQPLARLLLQLPDRLAGAVDQVAPALENAAGALFGGVLSGASPLVEVIAGSVLALGFLTYLLVDGERVGEWIVDRFNPDHRPSAARIADRAWETLGSYVRGVTTVALFDATSTRSSPSPPSPPAASSPNARQRSAYTPTPSRRDRRAADPVAILILLMSDARTPENRGGFWSLLQRVLSGKPVTPRRAGRLIALASLLLTLGGGLAVWVLDHSGIGDLGDSLWWAMQTVTTVGYGDEVPRGTAGRVIGAVLMLNGIALLSVITAVVTAMLVEQAHRRRSATDDAGVLSALERIESRLTDLDGRLDRLARQVGDSTK